MDTLVTHQLCDVSLIDHVRGKTILRALSGAAPETMHLRNFILTLLYSAFLPAFACAASGEAETHVVVTAPSQPDPPNWADKLQLIGLAALVFTLWELRRQVSDRSTDVVLELDKRFSTREVLDARAMVEDKADYELLKHAILWYMDGILPPQPVTNRKLSTEEEENQQARIEAEQNCRLEKLDAFLRFYALLMGIREAGQASDKPLRVSFAYWINHYWYKDRAEFRRYVDTYFRGLSSSLKEDRNKLDSERFFRPDLKRVIPEFLLPRHPPVI